jgi:tRNA G10  N-methylase Trm11
MGMQTEPHLFRVICNRIPGNELAAAECANLTGGWPDADGVADCRTLEHVWRAAYITLGVRFLAEAEDIEALAAQVRALDLRPASFRVEVLRLSQQPALSMRLAVVELANAIQAPPDLESPQQRFLLVVQAQRLWFGEILAEPDRAYRQHDDKPYRTSTSLPSRLARALVNLVAPPAQTLLDPFCGTGSVLFEACAAGLQAYGVDRNPKMAGMSRRNLAHFGYTAQVKRQDALDFDEQVDAIVTDLPYGRLLEPLDWQELAGLLGHLRGLARRAVYLAEEDLSAQLREAGYSRVELYRVRKRPGMSRYVHQVYVDPVTGQEEEK